MCMHTCICMQERAGRPQIVIDYINLIDRIKGPRRPVYLQTGLCARGRTCACTHMYGRYRRRLRSRESFKVYRYILIINVRTAHVGRHVGTGGRHRLPIASLEMDITPDRALALAPAAGQPGWLEMDTYLDRECRPIGRSNKETRQAAETGAGVVTARTASITAAVHARATQPPQSVLTCASAARRR